MSGLWFLFGLLFVVAIVSISNFITFYVPDLKDSVRTYINKRISSSA